MPVDEVPQSPREKRYGIVKQSVFGTAEIDSVAVIELDCEPFEFDRDVKEFMVNGAHGSRQQNVGDMVVHNRNCMPKFTTELFLKKAEIVNFFTPWFQNVTEGVTPEFEDTWTLLDAQPDFQADAGYFFTIFERDPVAAKSWKVKDCLLSGMTITLEGDEPLKASLEWIGLGLPESSTPSGTWTRNALTNMYYNSDIDTCLIVPAAGSASYHLESMELAFTREVKPVGQDGSGGPQLYALSAPEQKFKLTCVKDSGLEGIITDWTGGVALDARVGWGGATPGDADGDLDFAMHGIIDGPNGIVKNHDDPMTFTMSGKLMKDGATESITVIHADSIDTSWIT